MRITRKEIGHILGGCVLVYIGLYSAGSYMQRRDIETHLNNISADTYSMRESLKIIAAKFTKEDLVEKKVEGKKSLEKNVAEKNVFGNKSQTKENLGDNAMESK